MRQLSLALLVLSTPLAAQESARIPAALQPALDALRASNAWTLEQQRTICEIPAPPFKEAARAAEFRNRFGALGYADAKLDGIGNVLATYGTGEGPLVVLSAHLDTVFPEGTDVRVATTGTLMKAPGIGDDCRGLAVMLAVGKVLQDRKVRLPGTLVFAALVGEEGLGNSRGARYLLDTTLAGRTVEAFLTIDLSGFEIVNTHVGSHRYKVTFQGPGGHSYGAFGMPNPMHALGRAVAGIADLRVPTDPKTTFNVGIIEGGRSVNSITDAAAFLLDLRSSDADTLEALDARVRQVIAKAVVDERARWPQSSAALTVAIDTLGIRYAGYVAPATPLMRAALSTARALGGSPTLDAASTDAAAATRLRIPAIAIGAGGKGAGEHSLDETYDDGDRGWTGPQWSLLLTATLLGLK